MVRLTDRPDMTLDANRGRKTTNQQQQRMAMYTVKFIYINIYRKKVLCLDAFGNISMFFRYFTKGKKTFMNSCCLPPIKRCLLLKERICSCRSKFFSVRVDHTEKEGKNGAKRKMAELFPLKFYTFTLIQIIVVICEIVCLMSYNPYKRIDF